MRSYKATEDDIGEDFTRAENYLSLVGLVIVILGGIGVSSVTRVFVQQKMKSIAVLKCVGARSAQLLAVYVAQVAILGLAGSLLGVADGRTRDARDSVIAGRRNARRGDQLRADMAGNPARHRHRPAGVLAVFAGAVARCPPREAVPAASRRGRIRAGPMSRKSSSRLFVVAGLVGLTVWQAGSLRIGCWLPEGLLRLRSCCTSPERCCLRAIKPLARSRSFALRHAVLQLSRPGSQMRIVLLAVGLGSFFIIGVRSLQENLVDQFSVRMARRTRPTCSCWTSRRTR